MKAVKTTGAVLCIGLAIAKAIGLAFVLSDPASERESAWIVKQAIYALSFIALGV